MGLGFLYVNWVISELKKKLPLDALFINMLNVGINIANRADVFVYFWDTINLFLNVTCNIKSLYKVVLDIIEMDMKKIINISTVSLNMAE